MFSKRFLSGAALSAFTLLAGNLALAQETTSALRGAVTDESGNPLADVNVSIVHVPTGTRSSAVTNSQGVFDARGLRVGGPYRVEFEAQDYRGQRQENIFLQVGDPARLAVELEDEEIAEMIVVAAPTTQAGTVGSATNLNRDDIAAVVSITRDIRDLARRDPLVSQNARGDGGILIAGSNPRTNRITIDGVQAQDSFGLNTGGLPTRRGPVSIDAVQAFQVEAVPFDVKNGDFLGGSISVVLAQGTNEFDGSVFFNYLNDGFVGERIDGATVESTITQDNYGAAIRGPILKDRLFFALSYETYESADPTDRGPAGLGFANGFVGIDGRANSLTQANIDAVTNVFANTYRSTFPFGQITSTKPITDEKYTARIDWNITDNHRAQATYRFAESGVIQRTNLNSTSAGLDSQWYLTGEEDQTVSIQINSDWTSALSTEVRLSKRDYTRLQEPPAGQEFADIRVCATPTSLDAATALDPTINCRVGNSTVSVVRFGPDQFRHANFLETADTQGQFEAQYVLGRHLLKAGAQWNRTEIFNLFVPNSDGTYYFDSIADFAAGRAGSLVYRNALTNKAEDAAADFSYDVFTLFAQDAWDITDSLTVTGGVRWDAYTVNDDPARNPNFAARYNGRSNQETYDGRDVLMPRFSATWRPTDELKISGGVGLFSGGLPDVFLSNVFSNTGILDNNLEFRRTGVTAANPLGVITELTGAVNCVTQAAVCNAALNVPVTSGFGASIPAAVQAALGATTSAPTAETNIISPDFEIPSDWRANISARYDWQGFQLGLDGVYVVTNEGLAFRDIRAQPLIVNGARARTPDGRLRYDGLSTAQRTSVVGQTVASTNPGASRDIEAFNPGEENTSWTLGVSLAREWDNGVNFLLAYTVQEIDEFSASARFSSTASSLYGGQYTSFDPNSATSGRGQEEVEDNFKMELGFRRAFVSDLETRFSLFGEYRAGRPTTFTMNGGGGRNATFGVNRGAQLAYVPNLSGTLTTTTVGTTSVTTISSDPLVAFDSAASVASLQGLVRRFGIPTGGIVPRGTLNNKDVSQFDFQISQELPALREGHRTLFTIDIGNFANLINDEWGIVREFPEDYRLFDVACAGADGVADNDGALTCNRYRISGVNTTQGETTNTDRSRWTVQLGLRYQF
jgi:outer membrane receptor protein involved in Fe transport